MSVSASTLERTAGSGYRHEALLYSGIAEFVEATLSFVRDAIAAVEPILVVVSGAKIDLLRQGLGADSDAVEFADMAEVGLNPARIIAAWQDFVSDQSGAGRQVRGIGEPVYPERSAAELSECQLHEALLNVAFDRSTPFWLLCPYDVEGLAPDVIDEAHRAHPYVARGTERGECQSFQPLDWETIFDRPLPAAPPNVAELAFRHGPLTEVRTFVLDKAQQLGLDVERTLELVVAVNELATNSIQHGGGRGTLRMWTDHDVVVVEVADSGHITKPLAGRVLPPLDSRRGRGLWMANQLCDLVQIRSAPGGTVVRVRLRLVADAS